MLIQVDLWRKSSAILSFVMIKVFVTANMISTAGSHDPRAFKLWTAGLFVDCFSGRRLCWDFGRRRRRRGLSRTFELEVFEGGFTDR